VFTPKKKQYLLSYKCIVVILHSKIRLLDLLKLQERNNSSRYSQLGYPLKSRIERHLLLIPRPVTTCSALLPAQEENGKVYGFNEEVGIQSGLIRHVDVAALSPLEDPGGIF